MLTGDHWLFYPDIQVEGGLAQALDAKFAALGVTLDVHGFGAEVWAQVKANKRFCQVCFGAKKRIIMPDFWADGVHMGNIQTTDLHVCAEAIAAWLHGRRKSCHYERSFCDLPSHRRSGSIRARTRG